MDLNLAASVVQFQRTALGRDFHILKIDRVKDHFGRAIRDRHERRNTAPFQGLAAKVEGKLQTNVSGIKRAVGCVVRH